MEHAKRMVIISQDALEKMHLHHQQATKVKDTASELDTEMFRLLNNKSLSDHDKWNQYQQVLQRFLHFSAEKRKPLHLHLSDASDESKTKTSTHGSLGVEEIIDTFSKTYKQDARNLLKVLEKRNDLFDWDSDGIVYVNGEKVPNSNVTDILHDVIRARKSIQPTGWHQFMHVLKQINMPHEFITNPFSREFLTRLKETDSDTLDRNKNLEIIRKIESDPQLASPASKYVGKVDALYGSPYRTSPASTSSPLPSTLTKQTKVKWEKFKL